MPWEQLTGIARSAAQEAAAERAEPPVACPNDGTQLEAGPDGVLFCPWDGWRTDGTSG